MSPLTQAATDCAAVTEIPSTECEALVALYNSTDGDNWDYNRRWLKNNTPCSWYRVTCRGGHVSNIDLWFNDLTGTIPTELGNLSNLTTLYLYDNELTGSIPTELGNLSNLTITTPAGKPHKPPALNNKANYNSPQPPTM
jgi:Leucine-rich repeat (LRR) protein